MSECLWAGGSGRVEWKMVPSLIHLLSCESSVSMKENPDRKKKIIKKNSTPNVAWSPIQLQKQEEGGWIKFEKRGVGTIGGLHKVEELGLPCLWYALDLLRTDFGLAILLTLWRNSSISYDLHFLPFPLVLHTHEVPFIKTDLSAMFFLLQTGQILLDLVLLIPFFWCFEPFYFTCPLVPEIIVILAWHFRCVQCMHSNVDCLVYTHTWQES